MEDYEAIFPVGLSSQAREALRWKIEQDYRESHHGAITFKNEYILFALRFYLRNSQSLNDVMAKYSLHKNDMQRNTMADAFLADMRNRMQYFERAH